MTTETSSAQEAAGAADGLQGNALADAVWLDRAAVTNWARHTDGPADLHDARFGLLDTLRAGAVLRARHPGWMTSPKPGVDAWVDLGDHVTLALRHDPTSGRTWRAVNCLAPKRGRRRTPAPSGPQRPAFTAEQAAELAALTGEELLACTLLSEHCFDRLRQRTGTDTPRETLRRAIVDSGRVVSPSPGWADGVGYGGPALLCDWDADTLALPLAPNRRPDALDPPRPYVATTCIALSWAQADLPDGGQPLADCVSVSERAAAAHLRRLGQDATDVAALITETEQRIVSHGRAALDPDDDTRRRFGVSGPHITLGDLCLKLRSADREQRAAGKRWFVAAYLTD